MPYKGGGPAVVDLIGGHVPLLFVGLAPALPHIREGRIKTIAMATPQQFAGTLRDELNRWGGVIRSAAIKPE